MFTEAGIPCPPCSVLGIPNCDWTDPFWFMENLQRCRDLYLLDEREELVKSVKENRLAPSLFGASPLVLSLLSFSLTFPFQTANSIAYNVGFTPVPRAQFRGFSCVCFSFLFIVFAHLRVD
jgi:hypothetical protein